MQYIKEMPFFKKMGRKLKKGGKKLKRAANKSVNTVSSTVQDRVNDIEDKVKGRANELSNTAINIRNIIQDKDKMPPIVEAHLKKHGTETITSVAICRSKVPGAITGALKVLSMVPYDDLFHLFLLITTSSGAKFTLEKNERILMNKTIPKNIEDRLPISELNGKVFQDVFYRTRERMGPKFLPYNASSNNCQNFILGILHANGVNKPEYNELIKQDTEQIFEDKPGLRKFANSTVKLGKIGNMLMSGGSVGTKKVNPWLAHVKQYREDNPGISYVEALKQAKHTYKK